MNAYTLPLNCPSCGAELAHINASRAVIPTEVSAICACPNGHEYHLTVHMRRLIQDRSAARRATHREGAAL